MGVLVLGTGITAGECVEISKRMPLHFSGSRYIFASELLEMADVYPDTITTPVMWIFGGVLAVFHVVLTIWVYRELRARGTGSGRALLILIGSQLLLSALWWPAALLWLIFGPARPISERDWPEGSDHPECGQCGIRLRPKRSRCHFCQWEKPGEVTPVSESRGA